MRFMFLGTSSGAPTPSRNVSGLALRMDDSKPWYLIDCGEGTQHRLLRTDYSLSRLRAVFITHVHGDHCFGLPGLLSTASMMGRRKPLRIIGPAPLAEFIQSTMAFSRMHAEFEIQFIDVQALSEPWRDGAMEVSGHLLSHRVESYAYAFSENRHKRKLDEQKLRDRGIEPGEIWGRLQRGEDVVTQGGELLKSDDFCLVTPPRTVVVAGDNNRPQILLPVCARAQVLIHEATYDETIWRHTGYRYGHSCAAMVGAFANQAKIPHLLLTHFSPRYHHHAPEQCPGGSHIPELLRDEARRHYSGDLHMAGDLDGYHLLSEGTLVKTHEAGIPIPKS